MNINDLLTSYLDTTDLGQVVAKQLGADSSQVSGALQQLAPVLLRGLKRNAATDEGQQALTKALGSGNHERYLSDPSLLEKPEALAEGNAILGHIFGNKDVSRNVAGYASQQTGLDSSLVKKLLPMAAPLVMAAMSKFTQSGATATGGTSGGGLLGTLVGMFGSKSNATANQEGGLGGLLSMLDQDGDGSVADELLDLSKKFF